MEKICLKELYDAQKALDETIAQNHGVSYATTRPRRTLALLVELGEFANTTRCFKYWSNKGMEEKDVVLDEYADGMHFLLSLGIDIGIDVSNIFEIEVENNDLTAQILKCYKLTNMFLEDANTNNYLSLFNSYLAIIPLLGYSANEVVEAYFKKLGTNYVRQQTNY